MKRIAHLFNIRNKNKITSSGLVEKYQQATQELIAKLREAGYEVLLEEKSFRNNGVPVSIIVASGDTISPCDIKDNFFVIARDIRIDRKLGMEFWNFEPGDVYAGEE